MNRKPHMKRVCWDGDVGQQLLTMMRGVYDGECDTSKRSPTERSDNFFVDDETAMRGSNATDQH